MKKRKQKVFLSKDSHDTEVKNPRIIVYCCEASAYVAVQPLLATASRDGVKFVKVACTGLVGVPEILKSLEDGAYSVVVAGCPPSCCRHSDGSSRAERHVATAMKELQEAGLDQYRVSMCFVSCVDTRKIQQMINEEIEHDSGRTQTV